MENPNLLNTTWQSIREKWTVTSAIVILMVSFFVVIAIFVYVIYLHNEPLIDKILTIFNAFIMAILGYLFGYVPAKTSEESVKKDKNAIERQTITLNQTIDKYRNAVESKDRIIKDYETIIALYESE